MVRSSLRGLILLFFQPVFAIKGGGSSSEDAIVPVTLTTTSDATVPIPANGTATQSSMQPAVTSSAPLINISTLPNATTCMPMTFAWQVTLPTFNTTNVDVHLTITNDDVQQSSPSQPTTSISNRDHDSPANDTTRCVTNSTALSLGFFIWSAVTVPVGWYILDISPTSGSVDTTRRDLLAHSEKFFVMAGSNTSCVFSNILTSTAPSKSHFTSGALAGTVAGTVVGVAALIGAFVLPRLWRRGVPGHKAWREKHGLYQIF